MNDDDELIRTFDAYEIHPCRVINIHNDVEQCDPGDAEFWTLYGHKTGKGLYAIADFLIEQEAINLKRLICHHQNEGFYNAIELIGLILKKVEEDFIESKNAINEIRKEILDFIKESPKCNRTG